MLSSLNSIFDELLINFELPIDFSVTMKLYLEVKSITKRIESRKNFMVVSFYSESEPKLKVGRV